MHIIEATKYTKTYASRANAVAAVEKLGGEFGLPLAKHELTVVISKDENTARFYPVLVLRGQALQFAATLALMGFHVIG